MRWDIMKNLFFLAITLSLILSGCAPATSTAIAPTETIIPPSMTPLQPSPIAPPSGRTIIITSTSDSGTGTLRQALMDAQPGDTITFDPDVFPPDHPATIFLETKGKSTALPEITQGNLIIDASNAGVILDGSRTQGEWVNCISIRSNKNTVRGLQIINFPGSGIALMDGAQYNTIGGRRDVGSGLIGQGNLSSHNRTGIDLQGESTSYNIISGNMIGVRADGSTEWGNQGTGIYVARGASHNIIGPDNLIAYNTEGIQINGTNSIGNTLTKNSIHDNIIFGISILYRGNSDAVAPSVVGYDITLGTLTAVTCAGCMVEIYSTDDNQGETFEIQGTADIEGILTLDKGIPFKGPYLTAISTDNNGNTSGFSLPTSSSRQPAPDISGAKVLQAGNTSKKIELVPQSSAELEDNRMGTFTGGLWHPENEPELYPEGHLDADHILKMGFKHFRFTINNLEFNKVDWSKSEFSIDPEHDEFITHLAENGVKLRYVLSFWNTAHHPNGSNTPIPRFKTEEEIQKYLDYVRFIVRHLKNRVEYYEIWNEPNLLNTGQSIEVQDYINLVKRVAPVIREEYPDAKIVVGGTSSLIETASQAYLFKILNSEIMPLVDAISWHPMYGSSPEYEDHRQYYEEYPALVQRIRQVSAAHDFKGEYIADEIHWPTPSQPEQGWPTYTNIQSTKYLSRSIIAHLGMGIPVTQLLLVNNPQLHRTNSYLSTIMAGASPTNLPISLQGVSAKVALYSFSLPDNSALIALWLDGVAEDYDPGIAATVVIPGAETQKVTCMDVLNGIQQVMITRADHESLVIPDLMLKDYPLILRLGE